MKQQKVYACSQWRLLSSGMWLLKGVF